MTEEPVPEGLPPAFPTPPPLPASPPDPVRAGRSARREIRRRNAGRRAKESRATNTRHASNWVLAIAILQLVFGVVFGVQQLKESDGALAELSHHDDDETFVIDGKTMTTVELRRVVGRENLQAFEIPIGLAAVFFALFVWARRSPLPALGSALALFVTVHAISAVVDPKQLASGIIFKVCCIAGLGRGIKSALEERALTGADDTPAR